MTLRPLLLVFLVGNLLIPHAVMRMYLSTSLLQTSACFASVIHQTKATNVNFVCGSNTTECFNITNQVPGVPWTIFVGKDDPSSSLGTQDYCVIVSDDDTSILILLAALKRCQRANIIVNYPTGNEPRFAKLKNVFDEAWKLGIIDIVVVITSTSRCRVFTYNPFKELGGCYDTSPVLLTSWKKDVPAADGVTYFPKNKISTLRSCKLVFEHYHADTDVLWYWQPLLELLETALNATRQTFSRPDIKFNTPKSDGNASRIILAYYRTNYDAAKSFVHPPFMYEARIVLALPQQPVSSVQWFRVLNELSDYVWYGVGTSLVVTVVFVYILMKGRKDISRVVLFCVRPILAIPLPSLSLHGQARLYLASWLLFCLVLDASYHSKLLSKLSVPQSDQTIKSLDDFIQSGLVINFPETDADFIKRSVLLEPRFQSLRNKAVFVNRRYVDMVDPTRRDVAYIVFKSDFERLFVNMTYYTLADPVFFKHTSLPVRLTRPSPYERLFRIAVLRALGAGAFAWVRRKARHDQSIFMWQDRIKAHVKHLSLKALSTVFVLWVAGCGIASIAFLLECYLGFALQNPTMEFLVFSK